MKLTTQTTNQTTKRTARIWGAEYAFSQSPIRFLAVGTLILSLLLLPMIVIPLTAWILVSTVVGSPLASAVILLSGALSLIGMAWWQYSRTGELPFITVNTSETS